MEPQLYVTSTNWTSQNRSCEIKPAGSNLGLKENDLCFPTYFIIVDSFNLEYVHLMESISLNSNVLLENLAMSRISPLPINCYVRNFLNTAISIIDFSKPFLNFINDTMISYLNSKFDLNLSCAKDFWNLSSMVTWCIN